VSRVGVSIGGVSRVGVSIVGVSRVGESIHNGSQPMRPFFKLAV